MSDSARFPALGAGPIRRALLRTALVSAVAGAGGAIYMKLDQSGPLFGLLLGLTSGLVTFPVALVERLAQRASLGRRGLAGAVALTWLLAMLGTLAAYLQAIYSDILLSFGGERALQELGWKLEDVVARPVWHVNVFAACALPFVAVTAVRLFRLHLGLQALLTPALTLGLGWAILELPDRINSATVEFVLFMISIGGVVMAPGFAGTDAVERWWWGEAEGARDAADG